MIPFVNWLLTHPLNSKRKYISPAFGRFLEAVIYTLASYAIVAIADGNILSVKGAAAALIASPLMQGFAKKYRDSISLSE